MVIRILLVGETGTGKSFTGNSILGHGVFPVSVKGVPTTKVCAVGETHRFGTPFKVVDTPGVFSGDNFDLEVKENMEQCVELTHPGPQVFLFVFSCGYQFCENDLYVINLYKEYFGEDIFRHGVVVFTNKNSKLCKGNISNFVRASPRALQDVVTLCDNRIVPIDNVAPNEIETSIRILVGIIVDLANRRNLHYLNLDSVNNNCAERHDNPVEASNTNAAASQVTVSKQSSAGSTGKSSKKSEKSRKKQCLYNCSDELVLKELSTLGTEMEKMSSTEKRLKEEIDRQQQLNPGDDVWCVLAGQGLAMIADFEHIVHDVLGDDSKSLLAGSYKANENTTMNDKE